MHTYFFSGIFGLRPALEYSSNMSAAPIPSPSASIPSAEDKFSQADIAKVAIDYAKHVSTLASGSIVVVATFFEKFADLKFRTLVGWAMGFLASSILMSCVSMLALILHGARPDLRPIKFVAYTQTVLLSLSVMSFFTGIFFLSLFIMLNVAFGR